LRPDALPGEIVPGEIAGKYWWQTTSPGQKAAKGARLARLASCVMRRRANYTKEMALSRRMCLLAIDDDPATLELIEAALEGPELQVRTAIRPQEGLDLAWRYRPEVVIVDLLMPGMSGLEVLDTINQRLPQSDVVLLTGDDSAESAVEAIQRGATDYLLKPISVRALRRKIKGTLEEAARRHRAALAEQEAAAAHTFQGMIGRSVPMTDLFARIRRVAPHYRTALVLGDTGTGKELAAHALHRLSPVASGPLVVCNCGAIAESLFERELFGHVKGAFTGASSARPGFFEAADGGTLVLDEIGELPLSMQPKFLRAIQHQELQQVGSPATRKVDVRIVCATNRDLHADMKEGKFREDLYYRLSMVQLALPRLKERPEDLPLLARHFVKRFAREFQKPIDDISPRALAALSRRQWAGNVRELENVLGSACMLCEGHTIEVEDLPPWEERVAHADFASVGPAGLDPLQHLLKGSSVDQPEPLASLERRYAAYVLEHCGGNKVRAAQMLGVSRATLYKLLEPLPAEAGASS
jgi:DNA-binding NtrC family response regulator